MCMLLCWLIVLWSFFIFVVFNGYLCEKMGCKNGVNMCYECWLIGVIVVLSGDVSSGVVY